MTTKMKVSNLYKIFGTNVDEALSRLKDGQSKQRIFEETGQTVGVQDASFSVDEGEIFVIMGLSGSGKSTLVRLLNGLIKPSSGQILIDDQDVASADEAALRRIRREKIAMVFQHFALFPHKTVVDNVAFGLKIKGMDRAERREKALVALDQVGLKGYADTFTEELSGGMQQRVGLARGLATQPEILLMDEPFGALDPLIRRDMQGELIELQRRLKKTIIFITHDLDEALILGDRIAIMNGGRIVQIGTAREIVDSPADDYVSAFTQDIDRARVLTAESAARKVGPLDIASDTVESAKARMEELNRDALYVVREGKPVGLVTYRGLPTAKPAKGKALEAALITRFPSAPAGTPLKNLYELAGSGLPIAVVDDQGSLIGVIEAPALFEEIAVHAVREDANPELAVATQAAGDPAAAEGVH